MTLHNIMFLSHAESYWYKALGLSHFVGQWECRSWVNQSFGMSHLLGEVWILTSWMRKLLNHYISDVAGFHVHWTIYTLWWSKDGPVHQLSIIFNNGELTLHHWKTRPSITICKIISLLSFISIAHNYTVNMTMYRKFGGAM